MVRICRPCLAATVLLLGMTAAAVPELPKVWMSFSKAVNGENFEACAADCKAHGVDVVEAPRSHAVEDYRLALMACRKLGLKMFTSIRDASRSDDSPDAHGPYEPAVMIGGVYKGLAVDRNLFSFVAAKHEIVLEPPVYSVGQPYLKAPHYIARGDGHYFDGYVPTGRAEVIVPERPFDGKQHLKVVSAAVEIVPSDTKVEKDTAARLVPTESLRRRILVKLTFDLTGLDACLLDKVGLAVYWQMATEGAAYDPRRGAYSMFSPVTRRRERDFATEEIALWKEANGGTFPSDVVIAARLGDESFYVSGWCGSDGRVNFPTWDCSESACAAFAKACPELAYPRVWGHPEVYGREAPAKFLYLFHRAAAEYLKEAAGEFRRVGVKVFRNTTRAFVWSPVNEHDGTGQELLADALDFLHLDPYPVGKKGYDQDRIPSDLAYFDGLSRRFSKPVIVWMQAHAFKAVGLTDSSSEDIRRMYDQVSRWNPASIMWLGYCPKGEMMTFPVKNPGAWEAAKEVHEKFHRSVREITCRPDTAVWRDYASRAEAAGFGDSDDERLGRRLHDWSAKEGGRYDVFEISPFLNAAERARIDRELSVYREVIRPESASRKGK